MNVCLGYVSRGSPAPAFETQQMHTERKVDATVTPQKKKGSTCVQLRTSLELTHAYTITHTYTSGCNGCRHGPAPGVSAVPCCGLSSSQLMPMTCACVRVHPSMDRFYVHSLMRTAMRMRPVSPRRESLND